VRILLFIPKISSDKCKSLVAFVSISVSVFTLGTAAIAAEPYLPKNDSEVLENLPRNLFGSQDELTTLRRQLAGDPNNIDLASTVAARYLQIGKQEGDPRFYGYARAAISPWWEATNPPPAILKLRAKLKERNHDYDQALVDLSLLLEERPRDVQAWIELSNIYRVQGKYTEAQQACDTLSQFASQMPITLCRVPLQAATGEAEAAYDSLSEILPTARERWSSVVQWILIQQAEISRVLGREQQAEQHYREALVNAPEDQYPYADFLLDRNRGEEALSLLRERTRDTGILLRAAIAARRCGKEALAAEWQTQLEIRFEEIRLRGSQPHGRFEARYALELKNDPERALTIALANWKKQKEARDTRNVLEAAIATENRAAARPALEFLEEYGTEDVVLQKLAKQLERN